MAFWKKKKFIISVGVIPILLLICLPIPVGCRGRLQTCAYCRMYGRQSLFLGVSHGPRTNSSFTDFYEKSISFDHEHAWVNVSTCTRYYNILGQTTCWACGRSDPLAQFDPDDQVTIFKKFHDKETMFSVLTAMADADPETRQSQITALTALMASAQTVTWEDWWKYNKKWFLVEQSGKPERFDVLIVTAELARKAPLACAVMAARRMDATFCKLGKARLLAKIACIYSNSDNGKHGDKVLAEALYEARTESTVGLQHCGLVEVAKVLMDYGKPTKVRQLLEEAEALARQEEEANEKARSFVGLAALYHSLGDDKKAADLLGIAHDFVVTAENHYWKAVIMCEMADVYLDLKKTGKAQSTIELALIEARSADSRDNALISVAESFEKLRQHDKALEIAESIKSPYWKAITHHNIAEICSKQKESEKAWKVMSRMTDPEWKGLTLVDIAHGFLKAGMRENALETVEKSLQFIGQIEDSGDGAEALIIVSNFYNSAGEEEKALRMLSQATQLIGSDWSGPDTIRPRRALARAYVAMGESEKALDVASNFEDDSEKAELLGELAISLAAHANLTPKLLHQMLHRIVEMIK